MSRRRVALGLIAVLVLLAGCAGGRPVQRSEPVQPPPVSTAPIPAPASAPAPLPAPKPVTGEPKRGGYYLDDGPAEQIPQGLEEIPDAEPKLEPLNRGTARPYVVFGKSYKPHTSLKPFRQRGVASWYGKKFHGQKTSSGERYDMFAMTAAHTVLPIPSYVRVTNPANGKSVVVRINDRGPFHADRIIDLSYTAAQKLGYVGRGSTEVEIEQILPEGAAYAQLAPPKKPEPAAGGDELATLIGRLDSGERGENGARSGGNARPVEAQPGVYLQLGAFGNPDNADNLRLHLERELDWLSEGIRVFAASLPNGNPVHRVQAGPFASRSAAEKAAERIRETMGSRPALLTR